MNKDSSRLLNAKQPKIGTVTDNSIGHVAGVSSKLEYRVKPPTPDHTLQENRYDYKYVPPGGVNVVSPMLSMKYNLSKEKIKYQVMFTNRLKQALIEEDAERKHLAFSHFYCNGCNGLLFLEKDIVYHAPVYHSSQVPRKLKIMEGDTSNVALNLYSGSGQVTPANQLRDEDDPGAQA